MSGLLINSEKVLTGIPTGLRDPLLEEFRKIVRDFREGRWEPAELNGGKFAEVVYTILKGHVNKSFPEGPSKPQNMEDACRALGMASSYPRFVRIQIPRMLLARYEIRNNRNVGHVGGDVDPNHMDASIVLSITKWIMGELIRVFHCTSVDDATRIVESLTERTVPLLWKVGDRVHILGSGLSALEKTLVILYGKGPSMEARAIAEIVEYRNFSRFRRDVLARAHKGNLLHFDLDTDMVTLSPIGVRYVEENIPLEV